MIDTAGLPDDYRVALRAGCTAALDAGIFYQDEFRDFVLPRIAGVDPARDDCLGTFEEPAERTAHSTWNQELRARIAAAPRGTWLLQHHAIPERGLQWFTPMMSNGSGAFVPPTDHYDTRPGYEAVYRRMAGYEIYLMREEVEAARRRARNTALIAERGFRPGSTFRNLRIGADRYSSVTITALHPPLDPTVTIVVGDDRGEGWLTLAMTKRGSRNRFRADLSAAALASAIDEASAGNALVSDGAGQVALTLDVRDPHERGRS